MLYSVGAMTGFGAGNISLAGALANDGRLAVPRRSAPVWPDDRVHVRDVSGGVAIAAAGGKR
jgi:hypothetical protein